MRDDCLKGGRTQLIKSLGSKYRWTSSDTNFLQEPQKLPIRLNRLSKRSQNQTSQPPVALAAVAKRFWGWPRFCDNWTQQENCVQNNSNFILVACGAFGATGTLEELSIRMSRIELPWREGFPVRKGDCMKTAYLLRMLTKLQSDQLSNLSILNHIQTDLRAFL